MLGNKNFQQFLHTKFPSNRYLSYRWKIKEFHHLFFQKWYKITILCKQMLILSALTAKIFWIHSHEFITTQLSWISIHIVWYKSSAAVLEEERVPSTTACTSEHHKKVIFHRMILLIREERCKRVRKEGLKISEKCADSNILLF